MRIKRLLQIVLLAVVGFLLAGVPARADSFNVNITFSASINQLNPLTLVFDLSEPGSALNTVTFSSFNFGGGGHFRSAHL